jgi:RNA polymerase sigma-70 factor (ECF subfamily)
MAEGNIVRRSLAAQTGDVDLERDRALVVRCQEGDGAAFAELYTQYHDRLHRFCFRRLLDRDEADEVTQEAFLKAWRALPNFAGGMRFYPWLTVIAKNLSTDVQRRRARHGTVENFDGPANDVTRADPSSIAMSSEEAVMASFDGQMAAEAMTRLSDRHRNVLALREEAGLSYQEIAKAEGVEISTVETLLWRARQALRREYAALSGVRVLGGILIAGASLRQAVERLARRSHRLALAASRINLRGLAAAGVVTVALASVAATQTSTPAKATVPGQAATTSSPSPSVGGFSTNSSPPTTPAPSQSPSGLASVPTGPSAPTGTQTGPDGFLPGSGSGIAGSTAKLPPSVAAQVPTILNNVTSGLAKVGSALSQAVGTVAGALPPSSTPPTLPSLPPISIPGVTTPLPGT